MDTIGATEIISIIFIVVFGFVVFNDLAHMKKEKRFYNEED